MTDKLPEEYNPFAMMVEFKIFKEFTVPIVENPIQRGFLDNLEKLELTEAIPRTEKIVNYHDGSEHIHKQILDDPEVWTALWGLT